jgi:hypothetical protein
LVAGWEVGWLVEGNSCLMQFSTASGDSIFRASGSSSNTLTPLPLCKVLSSLLRISRSSFKLPYFLRSSKFCCTRLVFSFSSATARLMILASISMHASHQTLQPLHTSCFAPFSGRHRRTQNDRWYISSKVAHLST